MIPFQTRLAAALPIVAALSGCNAPERPSAPPPASGKALSRVNDAASAVPAGVPTVVPVPVPVLTPPPPPAHYVIAAIGDSLTDPRSHGGGYLDYLKSRCPTLEIDNFGKGATMVNQMRRSFDEQIAPLGKRYTHLVVFGGVNDLYSDLTAFRTPEKIEADLAHIYAWGKAHEVQVIALTVAPWGGFKRYFNPSRAAATLRLNDWIRDQPGQGHVDHVVDAYALLSCGDPENLCERYLKPFKDGLHFGPEGHARLGQALFQEAFSDCQ